ncbi:RyR domain-containing protein [Novosphingobium sp.]|uniref:RyR domain-containing protein n=1 Tax=Novosphingobium sp. TaxID=1874826 RepID=UPI00333EAB74
MTGARFALRAPGAGWVAMLLALLAGGVVALAAEMVQPHPGLADLARLSLGQLPAAYDAGADPPPLLALTALVLPLLELGFAATLLWILVRAPLRLRLVRLRGDHVIIAGTGELARIAATQAQATGGAVLLWQDDHAAGWARAAQRRGAGFVTMADLAHSVAALGLARARSVLLLGDDPRDNADWAARVLQHAAQVRAAGDPLAVIARIDDPALCAKITATAAQTATTIARLRFAALADLAARQLFLDWPLDRFRRAGVDQRRVVVFGFSPLIERYVLRMLAGTHYRDGVRPQFHIVVPAAAGAAARFQAAHPGADSLSPLAFAPADWADADRAVALALSGAADPVAVLIDPDDTAVAPALVAAVDRYYRKHDRAMPPVHVRDAGDTVADHGAMVHAFGGLDQFADADGLLQDAHDALARSIHDFYLEGRLAAGDRIGSRASMQEWDNLADGFRDDNRLVADCYQLKLRDIGARVTPGGGPPLRLEPAELEDLARAEHDRWMAAKLADGWVHGTQRDDARRLHPDIVPYHALTEAVKDLDREQVRVMTRLLAASGARTLRVLTVAIEPGVGTALVAGLPALLAAVAAHWPDRVVILSGAIDDAPTRRALATCDARVRIVVAGNAGTLIDRLDPAGRSAVQALLAQADTMVAALPGAGVRDAVLAGADLVIARDATPDHACPVVRLAPDGRIRVAPWLTA